MAAATCSRASLRAFFMSRRACSMIFSGSSARRRRSLRLARMRRLMRSSRFIAYLQEEYATPWVDGKENRG
jgi:hypothetical protein